MPAVDRLADEALDGRDQPAAARRRHIGDDAAGEGHAGGQRGSVGELPHGLTPQDGGQPEAAVQCAGVGQGVELVVVGPAAVGGDGRTPGHGGVGEVRGEQRTREPLDGLGGRDGGREVLDPWVQRRGHDVQPRRERELVVGPLDGRLGLGICPGRPAADGP